MLVANIEWPLVRLSVKRVANNTYSVARDVEALGQVWRTPDGLWGSRGHNSLHNTYVSPSWKTAVLRLARRRPCTHELSTAKTMTVRRICVDSIWYTVIDCGRDMKIFEDHPKSLTNPSPDEATRLRHVFREVAQYPYP